jgi:hypothetical protein
VLKSGSQASFTIEARDQYDNLQETADKFLVDLVGPVTVPGTVTHLGKLSTTYNLLICR